ncbi:MAG TPA: Rieske 2Fe-2S domain-containing protein [Chloroflexota bacterium]|nr:Rieske 2Fe-2S domain-containing protein [Chloroflexota bacterium]
MGVCAQAQTDVRKELHMYPALDRYVMEQKWLDSLGEPLQKTIDGIFSSMGNSGKQLKNLLNGTWLGHPLHPVITDVPVGAWTTSMVLDTAAAMTGNEGVATAADIAVGTGIAAAVGAALTGFTDWSDTYGKERKVGLLHGLLMGSTTVLYSLSLVSRLTGNRKTGTGLSNLAAAVLTAGAYLGGDEVFDIGYGVNHTAFEHGPTKYTQVIRDSDLEEGKPVKVDAAGVPIVLVKQGSHIHALSDTCVHAGCSLAGGKVEDDTIICPCHGSQYSLVDGSVINGPATAPEPYYDTRVRNDMVEVRVGR